MQSRSERLQHRQERFLKRHTDRAGDLRPDLWRIGVDHVNRMPFPTGDENVARGRAGDGDRPKPEVPLGVLWQQIGPAPLRVDKEQNFQGAGPAAGEVVDIAISPEGNNDRIIYIATNDGGIWKSTDGGRTWAPKTDFMPSLSMGAVTLDPGNPSIVYAGTGNAFDGGGVFSKGVGIYKSLDAAETWLIVGARVLQGISINRIVLTEPDMLLVATLNGLFLSIDGGSNFGANPPMFNDSQPILPGSISDLSVDPFTSSIVFACVAGVGIFVSMNGGKSFSTNLFNNPGAPKAGFGFIAFTQSTIPDNRTMYASVSGPPPAANQPPFFQLVKSVDGGQNWTALPSATARANENGGLQLITGNIAYDQTLGVDPQDSNRVYIGFQELYLSTDGGRTFSTPAATRNQVHFDHHSIAFSPSNHWEGAPTHLYVGTDGGISVTRDGGMRWSNLNEGLATVLLRGIDIGRNDEFSRAFTYGGAQDTGTSDHNGNFAGNDWHLGIDGDGGPVAVGLDAETCYGTDDNNYIRTHNAGSDWSLGAQGLPDGTVGLVAIDTGDSSTVYATVGAQLFQSSDFGESFTSIVSFPVAITAIGTTRLDPNRIWVGLVDGSVGRTGDARSGSGSTWKRLRVNNAPRLPVGGVAIDPADNSSVVVVYSGFSTANPANSSKHAFRTLDDGGTWADISGTPGGPLGSNLPDLPLHSVVMDTSPTHTKIIVASDAGVFSTPDGGRTWVQAGFGLPKVDCLSLAFDPASPPLLRAGTYGRSAFELVRPAGPKLLIISNLAFGTVALAANATLGVTLVNAGAASLRISGITRVAGSPDFQIMFPLAFPVTLGPGVQLDFSVRFQPTTAGIARATFGVGSNDPVEPMQNVAASGFAPMAVPMVNGIYPNVGPFVGGTHVVIHGSGFTNTLAVGFGPNGAIQFFVHNDMQVVATSPVGRGTVDVVVINGAGMASATGAADQFTYAANPSVTSVTPHLGSPAGGDRVIITGADFQNFLRVDFGGVPGLNPILLSPTQISVLTPAGVGFVDVIVETLVGYSSPSGRFTYATIPVVLGIDPPGGLETGNDFVEIQGAGFGSVTWVMFGNVPVHSFNVDSDSVILAVNPAGVGTVDVTVTNPLGVSAVTASDKFIYAPVPVVTAINPQNGRAAGGDVVTITGFGFEDIDFVSFGAVRVLASLQNADNITVTAPPGNGTVHIQIHARSGISVATGADEFTYE